MSYHRVPEKWEIGCDGCGKHEPVAEPVMPKGWMQAKMWRGSGTALREKVVCPACGDALEAAVDQAFALKEHDNGGE